MARKRKQPIKSSPPNSRATKVPASTVTGKSRESDSTPQEKNDPLASGREGQSIYSVSGPPKIVRWGLPGVACLHLFILSISFLQPVGLSETLGSVLQFANPYLQFMHFEAPENDPIYLAHAETSEQPLIIQVSTTVGSSQDNTSPDFEESTDWQTYKWPTSQGLAASDRKQRWLSMAVVLSESEQLGLIARWLTPLVKEDPTISAIRLVRVPTLLTNQAEDNQPPPYQARIIRNEGQIEFIQMQSDRLTSKSIAHEVTSSPFIAGNEDEQIESPLGTLLSNQEIPSLGANR